MQCLLQQPYAPSVSGLNIKSLHSLLCIQQMQTQNRIRCLMQLRFLLSAWVNKCEHFMELAQVLKREPRMQSCCYYFTASSALPDC